MGQRCDQQGKVDAHFRLALAVSDERLLREHLPTCEACSARYDRRLALEAIDPSRRTPQGRLGKGLGLVPSPKRTMRFVLPSLAVAAAACLFLFQSPVQQFVARGARAARASVKVFPLSAKTLAVRSAPENGTILANDELAFAYTNPNGRKYLMIYGVDDRGHIYWFHPSWVDSNAHPSGIPIDATRGLRELPEAISHRFEGRRLTVQAVFTDQPLSVQEAERLIKARPEGMPQWPSSAETDVLHLEVGP